MTDNGARAEIQRVERRLVRHDVGARQERDRIERRIEELESRVDTMATLMAETAHRFVVLESRMENVMARLDGHDLGFAMLSLDEKRKAALARMMRLGEKGRPIVPGEEGTSES